PYSWESRWASWLASCVTLRARSVKRSYMGGSVLRATGWERGIHCPNCRPVLRHSQALDPCLLVRQASGASDGPGQRNGPESLLTPLASLAPCKPLYPVSVERTNV